MPGCRARPACPHTAIDHAPVNWRSMEHRRESGCLLKTQFAKRVVDVVHCDDLKSKTMRTLLIPLMMVAVTATAAKPGKMFVIVRTTDKVIVDFTCVGPDGNIGDNTLLKSMVAENGQFNWHVVGGTAPFTVVKDDTGAGYGGCITVRDANGQEATGCGVVGVVHKLRRVNCNMNTPEQQGSEKNGVYATPPGNKDTCTVPTKCPPHAVTPPAVTPSDPTSRLSTPSGKVNSDGNVETPVKRLPLRTVAVKEPAPPRGPLPPVGQGPFVDKGRKGATTPYPPPPLRNPRMHRNAGIMVSPQPQVRPAKQQPSRPSSTPMHQRPSVINSGQHVTPRSH